MFNREVGNTRIPNGITQEHDPIVHDLLKRQRTPVPSATSALLDKLLTAYNKKALSSPIAPMIDRYSNSYTTQDGLPQKEDMLVARMGNEDRAGFASRNRVPDEQLPYMRWKNRYGVGVDNVLDPESGYSENEINTLLGKLDYGHDGDTAFAGFTPNIERTSEYYPSARDDGQPSFTDYTRLNIGDTTFQAGGGGAVADPEYFAGVFLPGDEQYIPDYDKSFNTPFGNLGLATNVENPNYIEATFDPNGKTQAYIQALANLLNRR